MRSRRIPTLSTAAAASGSSPRIAELGKSTTGFASVMFTHPPSRTVFIDNDRYLGEDWLGHWMAHELGHLATNSVDEHDADKLP